MFFSPKRVSWAFQDPTRISELLGRKRLIAFYSFGSGSVISLGSDGTGSYWMGKQKPLPVDQEAEKGDWLMLASASNPLVRTSSEVRPLGT